MGGALTAAVTETRSEALATRGDAEPELPADDEMDSVVDSDDSDAADNSNSNDQKSKRKPTCVFLHRFLPPDESRPTSGHLDLIRIDGKIYGVGETVTGSNAAISLEFLISTGSRAATNREKFYSIITSRFDRIERAVGRDGILFDLEGEDERDAAVDGATDDDESVVFEQEGQHGAAPVNGTDINESLEEEEEGGRETPPANATGTDEIVEVGIGVDVGMEETTDDEAEEKEVANYLKGWKK